MFVVRFLFLPADRRVAAHLAEAMQHIHAQRDGVTRSNSSQQEAMRSRSGFGLNAQR